MYLVADPEHYQTGVYFDPRRPPTTQELTERVYMGSGERVEADNFAVTAAAVRCAHATIVCTVCTIAAAEAVLCF